MPCPETAAWGGSSWAWALTCRLSAQMLEVGAHTRVRDVCEGIATRLQLASWEGCSLFIKISDKVCWPGRPVDGRRGSWGAGLQPPSTAVLGQAHYCTAGAVRMKEGGGSRSQNPGLTHPRPQAA